jgi:polysaccharide export outer membrane protein
VPNRKHLLLQKNDLEKKKYPRDTTVRTYSIEPFDYRIQTNDIISVRFQTMTQKEFDFLGQNQNQIGAGGNLLTGALLAGDLVDEQGNIPVPVMGRVKVAGLTIFQAQDTLQKLSNMYLEGTIVKVRLLNYRATVLGEVNREGDVNFPNNRVTLPEAIGLAGGLNEFADRSYVKVIRQVGSKAEVHYVDLLKEELIISPFYYVHQNDIIIVPPLRQRPFRIYFTQNLSVILSSISLILFILTLRNTR